MSWATPTPELTIRFATVDDAETIHRAIVGIARAMGDPQKVTSTSDDIRRFGFGDAPAFEALIAEADGACAGLCVFFASFSTYRGEPGVYVQDLFVEPARRGSGIGARLLQRLAAVTRQRGGGYIRLSVDVANADAQAFYTKLGLAHSRSERIHAAYDDDFDRLADADRDG